MKTTYTPLTMLFLTAIVGLFLPSKAAAGSGGGITFQEWAVLSPSGASTTIQNEFMANLEAFAFSGGVPVGTPGTPTYVGSVGSGGVTMNQIVTTPYPSWEGVAGPQYTGVNGTGLSFPVEITSTFANLYLANINWARSDQNVVFFGNFAPNNLPGGVPAVEWTVDANGNKTFVTDPSQPVNGILIEGMGDSIFDDALQIAERGGPISETVLYNLNETGYGLSLTVPINLPNDVPEPSTGVLLAIGFVASFFFLRGEKLQASSAKPVGGACGL